MKKIYLAAPLFTAGERYFNRELAYLLSECGIGKYKVTLPQNFNSASPGVIYDDCIRGVRECDAVLAVIDGPDIDSGTAFELGYAKCLNKMIFAVRTDFRQGGDDPVGLGNIMITQAAQAIVYADSRVHGMPDIAKKVFDAMEVYLG